MNAFRHIISLGVKEIIAILRDSLLFLLIIYTFTVSIFTAAESNPDGIDHAAIAIVDEDQSELTKRLSDAFFPPLFRLPEKISRADVDRTMDSGIYTFVVVFPPNFQEKVLAGSRAEVQVNVDATRMSQAFTGNSYIHEIIARETLLFLRERNRTQISSADQVIRTCFNPNLSAKWEGAISELINNIAMIAMILTGAALIRERERGTLEHLMVTPVSPAQIMIAKIWSMSLIVFIATWLSLMLVINRLLAVPIAGSVTLFMFGVAICLFAITSMGIFLACFSKDMPQLGILMILVLMPMNILSGGTTPLSNMPPMVQYVMRLAPTTYIVEISKAIIFRGAEFSLIWYLFLEMFLLGCVYFYVALRRFRQTVSS